MLEIELKFRNPHRAAVEAGLARLGATPMKTRNESDRYFNAPDRDFRETDEVFRLRCVGEIGTLTYKGPKRAGAAKTREEHEANLAEGGIESMDRMLRALGYRPTAIVAKRRSIHALPCAGFDIHVCLDTLDGIGEFVEIEIVAEERDLAAAERAVLAVAADLGLTEPEPRAYLRMVLDAKGIDR
jgi:adenylate cyclase, class 2